jgi:hypothetical protein
MSKVCRFKAALLVGLVMPIIALSSCVNDLLTDIMVGVLFD